MAQSTVGLALSSKIGTATRTPGHAADSLQRYPGRRSAELLARGGRIVDAERTFNLAQGFGPEDDTLPLRFTREPVPSGLHEGKVCNLDPMLDEYYRLRGWLDQAHGHRT
jgi:aldehyde:ferredoxin oxidoreductase